MPFWYGMLAPAGTPREMVARRNAETVRILREPKVAEVLEAGRMMVIANTPEEFAAMLRDSHAAWGWVFRETGLKGE